MNETYYPEIVLATAKSVGAQIPGGERTILSVYDLGRLDGADRARAKEPIFQAAGAQEPQMLDLREDAEGIEEGSGQ